ncbi:MAG: cytochrome C [Ideonella sp. MAG2]|nr:MAG: cytochrome C [Ideonella sp. MAG2]
MRRVGVALLLGWLGGFAAAAPTAAPLQVPDTWAQRAQACTGCHGEQGRASPEGYIPRIAGKPEAYLWQQLQAFRDGRRPHEGMSRLLAPLSDEHLRSLARHFASLHIPYQAVVQRAATPQALALGQRLARQGDPARQLPACMDCHGTALMGMLPAAPGLLALPQDYLVAQLGAWRTGMRQARAPDCMAQIARQLSTEEVAAVAAWLATQTPPSLASPAPASTQALPLPCGSLQP